MIVLQEGFLSEGAWLPQLGDEVVYIAEGHQKLLEQLKSDAERPFETISANMVSLWSLHRTGWFGMRSRSASDMLCNFTSLFHPALHL